MTAECCKNCKFFFSPEDPMCRRFPPSCRNRRADTPGVFPVVYEDDWCGEWKEIPKTLHITNLRLGGP